MDQKKELEELREAQDIKEESLKDREIPEDNIFIIDCETGGLDNYRCSLLDVHIKSLQSDYEKTFYYKPRGITTHGALQINKLNWNDLIQRKDESNLDLLMILDKKPILIGHNIEFDIKFLQKIKKDFDCLTICTKELAKEFYNLKRGEMSLRFISEKIVKEYDETKAHTAKYDCYLVENLLKKMLKEDMRNDLGLRWLAMELKNSKE